MKILYILPQNSGGLPHYAAGLVNAVSNYQDVILLKPTSTTADDLFSKKIRIYELFEPLNISTQSIYSLNIDVKNVMKSSLSYRNLKIIREVDPDIVHNVAGMFPQVQLFLRKYNITSDYSYVETCHEIFTLSLSDPLFSCIELLNRAVSVPKKDRIIVHTKTQKKSLRRQLGSSGEIDVIPHGAFDFFKADNSDNIDETRNHLLFFGNIIPQKGLHTLVETIPLVRTHIPDVLLTIAGFGEISQETKEILRTYPEHFEVYNQFIPNEKVGELFKRSSVVVLPYGERWADGHSGPLTIAYSFGKPVIATDVGDFPQLVEGSGSGVVVPPDDSKQLANAIIDVLNNDDMRSKMGRQSRKMADNLSWENVARKHIDIYRELTSQNV